MSADTSQSTVSIQWQAWLIQNRKRLTTWGAASAVLVLVLVVFIVLQAQKEASASLALSEIEAPFNAGLMLDVSTAQAYAKLASQYPGTRAAGRALLLAGSVLFMNGNYAESQAKFEEFLKSYAEHPWVPQAMFGVAGALDAQKQNAAAIEKYEEIRRRYATAPVAEEARLCLGRLFEQENRIEEAYAIYDELVRTHPAGGLGAEAGLRREDLVERFPELAKTNVAPATTASLTPTPTPSLVPSNQAPLTIGTNIGGIPTAIQTVITNAAKAATNLPISIQLPPTPTQPPVPTPTPDPTPAPGAPPPAPAPAPSPAPAPVPPQL